MNKATLFILILFWWHADAFAQNKGLDPTFGNGGIAHTDIYTDTVFRAPTGLIIQPDGKILISGNFIARYKANGTPDSSFATNGFFKPPFTLTSTFRFTPNATAMALQADGKIVYIGKPNYDTGCSFIGRILSNGTPDSSFGRNGISKNNRLNPWNVLVQPNGKIIVLGNGCGSFGDPEDSVFVGRFLANGSVDTAFGKKGFTGAYLGIYGGSITNSGLLPDGRIAMGGVGYDDSRNSAMIALRFLPDGQLDTSLGGKGRIFPFQAWYCHGLAVLPDGRMVFSLADLNSEDITRLNADGSPDTTFGNGGFISIDALATLSILPMPDGRILCGGQKNGDYAVARLKPDGKGVDSSFGQNGMIATDLTGYWKDAIAALALQPDYKIIGVGNGLWSQSKSAGVMLVRYNANATTGIEVTNNYSQVALSLYPNPAQTYIRLSGVAQSEIASVRIIAADGRVMKRIDGPNSLTFPVGRYAPGIYLLSVAMKGGEAVSRRFTITE